MRKLLLLSLLLSSSVCAQRADNYKPDNKNVVFTETNLPIVFINTQGQMIDRENRITAKMKIIDNGEVNLITWIPLLTQIREQTIPGI